MSRVGRWRGLWLAAVLVVSGVGGVVPPASADGECAGDGRIFAVDSESGRLLEIPICSEIPGFGSAVEVDGGDWRGYSRVLAARDGAATVLYAVTADGELRWWRQEVSGAALNGPVRVAASVRWAANSVFVSRPGYLQFADGSTIRTFRHHDWTSGGGTVSEEVPLFTAFAGPALVGLATSYPFAVGVASGMTFNIRRFPHSTPDDQWYQTGTLPAGISGVVGDDLQLYGIGPEGHIALLRRFSPVNFCPVHITSLLVVAATAPGAYRQVVVPVRDGYPGPPFVGPHRTWDESCRDDATPWEWQTMEP